MGRAKKAAESSLQYDLATKNRERAERAAASAKSVLEQALAELARAEGDVARYGAAFERRHFDAENELQPAQSLNVFSVYVGCPRVRCDIGIIVQEHWQPAAKPIKEAADFPLKELN